MSDRVLTINGGSSSIKFALFAAGDRPARLLSGIVERIGDANSVLRTRDADGRSSLTRPIDAPNHERGVRHIIDWLDQQIRFDSVMAVGHRIVHGGPRLFTSQRVTPPVIQELKRLDRLDPVHLPA